MDNPEIISPMATKHRRQTQQHNTTQKRDRHHKTHRKPGLTQMPTKDIQTPVVLHKQSSRLKVLSMIEERSRSYKIEKITFHLRN